MAYAQDGSYQPDPTNEQQQDPSQNYYAPMAGAAQAPAQAPAAPAQQQSASSLFQPGYLGTPSTYTASTVTPGTSQGTTANASQYDLNSLYGNWGGASGYNASTLDPNLLNSLGSNQTTALLQQSFQPGDQNSNNNLQAQLAAYGVTGGQAVGAMTQLQAQLAAAHSPALASAIQNSQANQLNAGQFNSNALNSQGQFNAGAQNTNTNTLNSLLGNALGQNNSNQESTNQFNATQGQQNNQYNTTNDLNAALANQQSTNVANNYNATAQNNTNAANVGEYNQSQNQQLNALLQQYYAQMNAFNGINGASQTAGNTNATNYGQDITVSDPFGQVFGALGSAGAAYAGGLGAKK